MGSFSWIAVKGRERAPVFAELGVEPTGGPEALGKRLSWGESETGWLVIWSTDTEYATPERLAMVSRGAEAVSFSGTTIVMAAETRYFRDGQGMWTVAYDCERDPSLTWTGEPPAELAAILDAARRGQEQEPGADFIYDVPEHLAFSICGDVELNLHGLKKVGGKTERGFLARLFGRR